MLAYDIARCQGVGNDIEGWREGCEECLRRTEKGREEYQVYMEPPIFITFECEYLINSLTIYSK